MIIRLIHVDQLETVYLCYGSHVNLESFRVTWVKRSFTKNSFNSFMLHSMTIFQDSYMLISLTPFTYTMGSYINLGSFGVNGVERSFSLKMLKFTHVT